MISGSVGCFRQQLTSRCRLDEDCPTGWDCLLEADSFGLCLPREANRNPAYLAAPCSTPDASVSDASADAAADAGDSEGDGR